MVPAGEVVPLPVPVPEAPDFATLGIGQRDVHAIALYADSLDELLTRYTVEEMRMWRDFSKPGVSRLEKALERYNERHGTTYRLRHEGEPEPKPAKPFDWNDVNTWPATFNGADPSTWPREAIEQDVPSGVSWRGMAWRQMELRRVAANGGGR